MNLQYIVTQRNKRVRYIEKPPEIKRFTHNRQPCPKGCDCRCCKAVARAIAEIMTRYPKAYVKVSAKLTEVKP